MTVIPREPRFREAQQTGVADLYFVRAPGANENGALIDEATVVTDSEMGDLDSYYFDAAMGDNILIAVPSVPGYPCFGPSSLPSSSCRTGRSCP